MLTETPGLLEGEILEEDGITNLILLKPEDQRLGELGGLLWKLGDGLEVAGMRNRQLGGWLAGKAGAFAEDERVQF